MTPTSRPPGSVSLAARHKNPVHPRPHADPFRRRLAQHSCPAPPVHQPLDQVRETLSAEAREGNISAVRQINATIEQIRSWTGETGDDDFFAGLVARGRIGGIEIHLSGAADEGRQAFSNFADWLGTRLAPLAPSLDAVGEERYALDSRYFLGAVIDLEEAYQWGFEELHRIQEVQRAIAKTSGRAGHQVGVRGAGCRPGASHRGRGAFRAWMQNLTDEAVANLAGKHSTSPTPSRNRVLYRSNS